MRIMCDDGDGGDLIIVTGSVLQLTALCPFLPPSRCDIAGLGRRACSGEVGLLQGGELGRCGAPPAGAAPHARPQRQVW